MKTVPKIPGVVPRTKVQVVEVYSPERVCGMAKERGLKLGLSMDLVTGWNFDNREDRELAENTSENTNPCMLLGHQCAQCFRSFKH